MVETIKRMTSTRDMSLPQWGDAPRFPPAQGSFHSYHNPGYKNMGDNVRCGLLEFLPSKGASFTHEYWGIVQAAQVPPHISFHRKKDANFALSCIQSDLHHRLGRTHNAASINRHQIPTIPCDEGGWARIDDLLTMDMLWTHESRRIDNPLTS